MNKQEIKNALKDYNWMVKEIKRQRKILEDAGTSLVAQSGIESAMPKPEENTSDPVAREVIRRDKKYTWINRLEKKVSFIQERIPVITDERELAVLECLLDGMSVRAISNHMGLTTRHIQRIRNRIVSRMSQMSDMSDLLPEQKRCV
ncbi:MAG: DNA-binding response regulator [Bacillota bacterium]|uniref:DNA-binding response regulator n=1 Tax=Virgibacillus salarius TaxID=447199 RepID=A0A941IDA4_9BACI|nr:MULTISPECIES: DNA-binding response regulator [Virgibacillus]MBR7798346.1 DNA-binding response regulator [Virgibacillus salarius]MCC2252775.1 DNA-binding response regulator [Virgibacillus sp. AGTR]NAZ11055.1 DNA-binding response regulator [Agaribacter marinus]WBX80635.1 DNA-binding response regulator [Virgibacillus salarius]